MFRPTEKDLFPTLLFTHYSVLDCNGYYLTRSNYSNLAYRSSLAIRLFAHSCFVFLYFYLSLDLPSLTSCLPFRPLLSVHASGIWNYTPEIH